MILSPDRALHVGLKHFQLPLRNTDHGPSHWFAVWNNAQQLAAAAGIPGALERRFHDLSPMAFLCWFSFLHDCCRRNEGSDIDHGRRAAEVVYDLRNAGEIRLPDPQLRCLMDAVGQHSAGLTSTHRLTALCWDADRLDLRRVGVAPDPKLMSTESGRATALISAALHKNKDARSGMSASVAMGAES